MRSLFGSVLVFTAWAGCVTISGFNSNVDGTYETTSEETNNKPIWKKEGATVYMTKFYDGVWSVSGYKNPGAHQRMAFVRGAPDQANSPVGGTVAGWGNVPQGVKALACLCATISGFKTGVNGDYRTTTDTTNGKPVWKQDGANVYMTKFYDGVWAISAHKNPGAHQRMAFVQHAPDQANSPMGGTLYSWGSYPRGLEVSQCGSAPAPAPTKKPTKKPTKAPTKKPATYGCHYRQTACSYQPNYYRSRQNNAIDWQNFGMSGSWSLCVSGESLSSWNPLPYECSGQDRLKLGYTCCGFSNVEAFQGTILARLMRALGFELH